MRYSLHVNGLDNAYIREFGCGCPRCLRSSRAANTSVSLLIHEGNHLLKHVLVDAGQGVAESLITNPNLSHGQLDSVLLTHWHFDHTAELNKIAVTLKRSRARQGLPFSPVPVWCRLGSKAWIERQYPSLEKSGVKLHTFGSLEEKGRILGNINLGLPGLTLVPISISHYSADIDFHTDAPQACCAGFVLQTAHSKVALLWDLDMTNLWLLEKDHPAVALLQGCDHLFIDSNTWLYRQDAEGKPASHACFDWITEIATNLHPQNTWLMHLSGHEDQMDSGFGWGNERWRAEALKIWEERKLPGKVGVPEIGDVIAFI